MAGGCEGLDPRVLLDTSTPFDESKVRILDTVANTMYSSPDPQSVAVAHKVLSEFQNLPQAWTYVAFILSHSNDPNSKFFALRLLENCIQTRWQILPETEKAGIKQYVSELSLQLADNEDVCHKEKHFINKVNENLVQIVKHEWPDKWPTFITELCKSSRAKQSICENNMRLLVLLSEEVFDFGTDQLASKKLERLKMEFVSQFQEVFELCKFIIDTYITSPGEVRPSLIIQTLKCLTHFLKWIPLPFIFETQLVEILLDSFWSNNNFRIDCVRCLTEIGSLKLTVAEKHYLPKLSAFWVRLCNKVSSLPADSVNYDDTTKVPRQMRSFWETFYVQLALCLTAFLKNHRETVAETGEFQDLSNAMKLLARLSEIPHDETFKICMDFWHLFANALLTEVRTNYARQHGTDGMPPGSLIQTADLISGETNCADTHVVITNPEAYSSRLHFYQSTLREVRRVMIARMAKPQEVYIQYDEETGEVTRDYCTDTDEVALYNTMKDTQILLTHLGEVDAVEIMLAALSRQETNRLEESWNPTALNRVCYSIGAVSGAMTEGTEMTFLVKVIKNLLALCEMKTDKQNKAIVAANIMHVVGQYPRFLCRYPKFLQTVVGKLFEFMEEECPGVQKMACEVFLKVSQKCNAAMATKQPGTEDALIHVILKSAEKQTQGLEEKHALYFYQAVGHIISAAPENLRATYIQTLMKPPNAKWQSLMDQANTEPERLFDTPIAKEATKFLTTNQAVIRGCGAACSQQLLGVYQEVLGLYGLYSKRLMEQVAENPQRINHSYAKALQSAKRETLHLIETFISSSVNDVPNVSPLLLEKRRTDLMEHFVCPILQPVLEDYRNNPPATREYEVLSLMSATIECLDSLVASFLPRIFDCLFSCTLDMIKADFHSYPDHRGCFYNLLMMCNRHCFDGLFSLPQDKLRNYVESLVWAFKHEHPTVADQGLQITYEFIEKLICEKRNLLGAFCKLFYFSIFQEVLGVLTDTLHRSGFKYQTLILMSLIDILESNLIEDEGLGLTKKNVMENLVNLLVGSFETLNSKQVEAFVLDLFNYSAGRTNPAKFQTHVWDFLIQLKEFAGTQDDIYEMERQEALMRAQKLEEARRPQVSGLMESS